MPEPFVEAILHLRNNAEPREWRVLALRYGLDGNYASRDNAVRIGRVRNRSGKDGTIRTLEEVGTALGVTRERVRQIERRALVSLRHPSRRRLVAEAIEKQLQRTKVGQLDFVRVVLAGSLREWASEFPAPERWLDLLARAYPELEELDSPEKYIAEPRLFLRETLAKRGGSIDATEFAGELPGIGVAQEDINRVMVGLFRADLGYAWFDGTILVPRYKEVARFVLLQAGEPLHWKEIHARASELPLGRELGASTLYNAIQAASDVFVYRGPGTYGLREWGLQPKRFQKDVLVEWFREEYRNVTVSEVEHGLSGSEDAISYASIALYLGTHELFYEDLDGKFGLREWLPPPEQQRLDTPRHLREVARSRERLDKSSDPTRAD